MGALDSRGVEYTQWWSREPVKHIVLQLLLWRRKRRQVRDWRDAIRQDAEQLGKQADRRKASDA